MTDIIETTDNKGTDTVNVTGLTAEPESKYSLDYALEQIENISASTAYLDQVISELSQTKAEDPRDIVGQAKAQALADVVRCRETTNQKLLDFYMRMVDELNPKEPDYTQEKFKAFDHTLAQLSSVAADSPDAVTEALDTIRQIFKENFPVQQKSNTVSRLEELSAWLKTQNRDEYSPDAWSAIVEAVKGQMARND